MEQTTFENFGVKIKGQKPTERRSSSAENPVYHQKSILTDQQREELRRKALIDDKQYTIEYLLALTRQDVYIYDLRSYPDFSEKTLREAWDKDWRGFGNSGHFVYALQYYKAKGGTFEALLKSLEANKRKAWAQLFIYAYSDIVSYWKWSCGHASEEIKVEAELEEKQKELKEYLSKGNKGTLIENCIKNLKLKLNYKGFETWIQHSKDEWESASLYLKALGIEPIPVPSDYDLSKEEASKFHEIMELESLMPNNPASAEVKKSVEDKIAEIKKSLQHKAIEVTAFDKIADKLRSEFELK